MVTEPDDLVKLEAEVRALQSKIRMQRVLINNSNVSAAAKNIPGEFRLFSLTNLECSVVPWMIVRLLVDG